MKKCILSIVFCLAFTSIFTQTPKELIRKMKQSLMNLKSIDCEMSKFVFVYPDNYRNYNNKLLIKFDTNKLKRLSIIKMNVSSTLFDDAATKHSGFLINNNKYIEIKDFSREVSIEKIIKSNRKYIKIDVPGDFFPFFNAESLSYLDSMLSPNYQNDAIDVKKMRIEIVGDTACLSGDCYLLKIMAPSNQGYSFDIEDNDNENDSSLIVNFKMDNNFFWINKHTFFLERYRKEWTLDSNKFASYNDYRFTKIGKNTKISDSVFAFKKAGYKGYRIVERTAKGTVVTQEALTKAPDICGLTQQGDSICLYNLKARLYVIDFWFSKCGSCMKAKKILENEIIPKYGDKNVYFLGVNPIDKSFKTIQKLLEDEEPQYPYIINKQAARLYHLSSFPGIYILNNKFEVIKSFSSVNDNTLTEIKRVLDLNLK